MNLVLPDAAICDEKTPAGSRTAVAVVCGMLFLATALIYCQTARHEFVNYDDNTYVTENEHINRGVTLRGIVWMLFYRHAYIWHPLTSLSHMLDCQLFKLWAGGHHLVNACFHAMTAAMLFLVLRRMTGRMWPSALVAAIFAVHPLRVESVAWVAERKDVLSGLLFVLALGAYERFVREPHRARHYAALIFFFVLGLASKPMLVTLPFVLLLLDFWPLNRFARTPQGSGFPVHLIVEKIPLFVLSALDALLTIYTQGNAIQSTATVSIQSRLVNAVVAYTGYLSNTFAPRGLAVLYPHPVTIPASRAVVPLVIVVVIFAIAITLRRKAPYLLVGWLWYLGMLVPVIGLLQVGGQSMADRYTYLPQIGLLMAIVWAADDLGTNVFISLRKMSQIAMSTLAIALLTAPMIAAWQQTQYWRNSEILWRRDLQYGGSSSVAHYNLALTLTLAGRHREAIDHYREALIFDPDDEDTHNFLGVSLAATEQWDEAIKEYKAALKSALAIHDKAPEVHANLAKALHRVERDAEALEQWRAALKNDPKNVNYCAMIAGLLASSPQDAVRNKSEALQAARQVLQLAGPNDPVALDLLAAAQAEAGNFSEAVRNEQSAIETANSQNRSALAEEFRQRRILYEAHKPYRQPPTKAAPIGPSS